MGGLIDRALLAAGHLAGGDADHAAGNYLGAIEKYVLAFKQLAMI